MVCPNQVPHYLTDRGSLEFANSHFVRLAPHVTTKRKYVHQQVHRGQRVVSRNKMITTSSPSAHTKITMAANHYFLRLFVLALLAQRSQGIINRVCNFTSSSVMSEINQFALHVFYIVLLFSGIRHLSNRHMSECNVLVDITTSDLICTFCPFASLWPGEFVFSLLLKAIIGGEVFSHSACAINRVSSLIFNYCYLLILSLQEALNDASKTILEAWLSLEEALANFKGMQSVRRLTATRLLSLFFLF